MTSSSKQVAEAGEPASNKAPIKLSAAADEAAGNKPLTMRGRKRHKCTVCGNIARSRCPFFSCKGCCVKAGNSCQIHVLKASPTGESLQGAAAVPSQGPVTSSIVRHPSDSLRLRTVRPSAIITKKEAGVINSWRFHKLQAHTEGIAISEDETFDRYMQNMLLLEELFNVSYSEGHTPKGPLLVQGCSANETSDGGTDVAMVSAGFRMRQRSSSKKREVHRQKLKRAIDRSLQKLHKGEEVDDTLDNEDFYLNAFAARSRELKRMKVQSTDGKERLSRMEIFGALMEKIKVVESQEDFDLCLKTYEENFVNHRTFAGRHEDVSQMGTPGQHTVSGAGNIENSKAPMEKPSAHDLTFSASFKSRLDSFGVLKQSWKVDAQVADQCRDAFDISLSSLERL